jgi:hypothetical protein
MRLLGWLLVGRPFQDGNKFCMLKRFWLTIWLGFLFLVVYEGEDCVCLARFLAGFVGEK